jgi:hypothetical protein
MSMQIFVADDFECMGKAIVENVKKILSEQLKILLTMLRRLC